MTTTLTTTTAALPERPACVDDPLLWDSTNLHDHVEAVQRGCSTCAGAAGCELVGRAERASGTFGGKLLVRGVPTLRQAVTA